MAKPWMSVALIVCWLGACASVMAQPVPVAAQQFAPAGPAPQGPGGCQPFCPPPELFCPTPPAPEEAGKQEPCFHVGFEYLLWWTSKGALPPLLTSGSLNDPIPAALGQPNTRTLVSGSDPRSGPHSGARMTAAIALNPDLALSGGGFFLLQTTGRKVVSSGAGPGTPVLGRPFFNGNANVEDADPVAVPNAMRGTFTVQTPLRLYGTDANLRWTYINDRSGGYRLQILAGGRFLRLDEKLGIGEGLQDLPGLGAGGNNYSLREAFNTRNSFYGGQLGLDYETAVGPVYFGATGTLAAGTTYQVQNNSASTRITESDGTVTVGVNRGLLIQPSNAGKRSRDAFSIVPEATVRLGYDFNDNVRLAVGYDVLYWSGVARPGNQIDRAVNIQALQPFDQIGTARPAPVFNSSSFWAQGLTVSLGLTF
jgi:hypothetical protein